MRLYHGTNVNIAQPRVLVPNRTSDFGPGFYTTSSLDQARRWARSQVFRKRSGVPLIHVYEFDEAQAAELAIRRFCEPSKEWLDFIADHRLGAYRGPAYDLIIGPVANDRTIPVIQQYLQADDKDLFAPAALVLIKASTLADQYTFATARALTHLTFEEVLADETR